MLFSDANAPLALLILALTSTSGAPSNVTLVPRHVNSATSSVAILFSIIGSVVEQLIRSDLVLVELTFKSSFPSISSKFFAFTLNATKMG